MSNIIYNSAYYSVLEYRTEDGDGAIIGFEIVDKGTRRSFFASGNEAECFRAEVAKIVEDDPSYDEIDEFLGGYAGLMTQPLALH